MILFQHIDFSHCVKKRKVSKIRTKLNAAYENKMIYTNLPSYNDCDNWPFIFEDFIN